MTSSSKSYTVSIQRSKFGYGFELKDEGSPYKKYALISKVGNDVADKQGLKVGDKVIAINDVMVTGKDYVSLRNNMRKSANNCVKLEILHDRETWLFSPEPEQHKNPALEFTKRILVPVGSIRDKIKFFQKDEKHRFNRPVFDSSRSNSCGCIPELYHFNEKPQCLDQINATSLTSITNLMQNDTELKSDLNHDVIQPISQEPFFDYSIRVSCGVIEIPTAANVDRVLKTKSNEHIKDSSFFSSDPVFESQPEPFENNTIISPAVPKIEIHNFQSSPSFSTSAICSKLMPTYPENLSRSSTNLFEDVSLGWQDRDFTVTKQTESISMTDINSDAKKTTFPDKKHNYKLVHWSNFTKKLMKQRSILESIPIKLRIMYFKEKVKSKSWKDYIVERTENGVRFRKRLKAGVRHDKTENFEIKTHEINQFITESPHRRHKNSSGTEILSTDFSISKYDLMALNNHIHLKFFFNHSLFQDSMSSKQAYVTFKEIIGLFESKSVNALDNTSLSEPSNSNLHLSQSHENFTTIKEPKIINEDVSSLETRTSAPNTMKSTVKSPTESLSNNSVAEITPPPTKNILQQAFDKIKPEKKVKTFEVFTGTKAEYEQFKKDLESGNFPVEFEANDENGTNLNRFIHEVPRMTNTPKIPMVIYLCTEIVEKIGLKTEGIYRISGNQRVIRSLSSTLNKPLGNIDDSLDEWNNVHAVCGTLKLFLRKLKQNLIPADLSHVLAYSCKAVDCDDAISLSKTLMDIRYHLSSYQNSIRRKAQINSNKDIEDQLDCRWRSLQYLLKHLAKVVSYQKFNSMNEHALSICFNPVVMESWQKNINDIKADNEIMVKALELILIHQDWLFVDWIPHIDGVRSTELMADALSYAKKFIDKKYEICLKSETPDDFQNNDINVKALVYKIVNQATMEFGEKKKLERRHSSHMPGQKPTINLDFNDSKEINFVHRNSKATEALDLSTTFSLLKPSEKESIIEETKPIKFTYVSSTDAFPESDNKLDSNPKVILRNRPSNRRPPLEFDGVSNQMEKHKSDEYLNHKESLFFE